MELVRGGGRAAYRNGLWAALVLGLLVAWGASAEVRDAQANQAAARAAVNQTIDSVLAVLRDPSAAKAERQARIEEIAYARFDFRTISRLVLARSWRRLSEAQRDDFVFEFKRHLSLTYGNTLEDYKDETITIDSTRQENNGDVTVRTRIHGAAAEPIGIDYRLREKQGDWYVIDVIVEGVSQLQNLRSQTREIMGDGSPQRLIERLREKNAKRAAQS